MQTDWMTRVALARAGWTTQLRLTPMGIRQTGENRRAVGVWAKRTDWHGFVAEVTIHDHAIVDLDDPGAALTISGVIGTVREACDRAWATYPNTIPCLANAKDSSGRLMLAENRRELENATRRDIYPTETIPHDAGHAAHPVAGEDHVSRLMAAARTLDVADSVNHHYGAPRFISQCKDRDWGYGLHLAIRTHDGRRIAYRPTRVDCQSLEEIMVSNMIRSTAATLEALFEQYHTGALAGTTATGLPPGFARRPDQVATARGGS